MVLFVAGSQDVLAAKLAVSQASVLWTLRVLVFVLPVAVAAFSYRLASDLQQGSAEDRSAGAVSELDVTGTDAR